MVRNIVILGGNSHPQLVDRVCNMLGVPSCDRILSSFSVGESRCEIKDSVRGKDVYIIQSGGGKVNDHFMDLCIMISACKTGSAKRVTAVLPLFPYSRQPDLPYNKVGAPLSKQPTNPNKSTYTFESVPPTPGPGGPRSAGFVNGNGLNGNGIDVLSKKLSKARVADSSVNGDSPTKTTNGDGQLKRSDSTRTFTTHDYENHSLLNTFQAKPGYKQWVAQAGTLVADLLTCSGADHIITLDLHDAQYQGFFDIPVDNLYGRPLLKRYIQQNIPSFREAVVVSPDAGGAKRATAIADSLNMDFALIHKERRPTKIMDRQNATMMLVGDVANRVCVLVDDLADTSNTITRAAKLLKKEGATMVYALLTHGVLSGDAIARINASAIDKLVVTNSVPQEEHRRLCPKMDVLDISPAFAEAIRRVHHGESISTLFQYD
ncbi:phosphoribosyltransferase-like protein [Pseudomassariella vexata]|uniref:Phosphoribosyltransferase-like protein n=1 Tax=Pseudomassariella vexata TaxID=1141098 RepID=A0A1Y2D724_9PEZI|nr:phosphoribosyltransferase-like protein [Pseudomassariella vexata]ORY55088.1 phosphoribosyltransferase-like protein [Pseudomassariella vexata]